MLDIVTVIPPTLRTGIDEIDSKPKEKGSGNIFSAMAGVVNSMGNLLKNQRRFKNGIETDRMSHSTKIFAYYKIAVFRIFPSILGTMKARRMSSSSFLTKKSLSISNNNANINVVGLSTDLFEESA